MSEQSGLPQLKKVWPLSHPQYRTHIPEYRNGTNAFAVFNLDKLLTRDFESLGEVTKQLSALDLGLAINNQLSRPSMYIGDKNFCALVKHFSWLNYRAPKERLIGVELESPWLDYKIPKQGLVEAATMENAVFCLVARLPDRCLGYLPLEIEREQVPERIVQRAVLSLS